MMKVHLSLVATEIHLLDLYYKNTKTFHKYFLS